MLANVCIYSCVCVCVCLLQLSVFVLLLDKGSDVFISLCLRFVGNGARYTIPIDTLVFDYEMPQEGTVTAQGCEL